MEKPKCVTTQMKTFEQYFHALTVYFAARGPNVKSMDETLVCDHSNECILLLLLFCGSDSQMKIFMYSFLRI